MLIDEPSLTWLSYLSGLTMINFDKTFFTPFGGYVDSLADFNHLTDIGLLDLSYFFQSIARSRFITYHKKLPRILG